MKLTLLSLGLLLVVDGAALAQPPPGMGFQWDYAFRGPRAWQVGAHSIVFEYQDKAETVIRDEKTVIYSLPFPQVITGAVASENKKTLLIQISSVTKEGGWNHDRLMTVREEAPDEKLVIQECLSINDSAMKNRWVIELGAISDNGQAALVKMGEPDGDQISTKINHVWQLWDLKSQKLLRIGIKLCD